ncbi:uncharacterized protein VICG_00501 [Vittaforma corneae ATCC 50505]|uniref:Homeobox domain-containing protein n=1 Tax=Vittaforma corneae (strain ATCC 50505) TaxID=993615 RepID=L2GQ02_VITCO|nr:uncharacterized protein VICG_00501 [Vittaforma corneae ATCC 50505]ELA42402.1 hypothetical protein VICG_00501 [Vittaforma corneae ATCC 50505]
MGIQFNYSEQETENADRILYEYFRNNRYPKKAEKLRLAEQVGVDLQYVVNFFYNARSQVKKLEKEQQEQVGRKTSSFGRLINSKCRHCIILGQENFQNMKFVPISERLRGDCNHLYLGSPILQPALLEICDIDSYCLGKTKNDTTNQKDKEPCKRGLDY